MLLLSQLSLPLVTLRAHGISSTDCHEQFVFSDKLCSLPRNIFCIQLPLVVYKSSTFRSRVFSMSYTFYDSFTLLSHLLCSPIIVMFFVLCAVSRDSL